MHNAHISVDVALFWMKSQNPRVLSLMTSTLSLFPSFTMAPVTGLGSHSPSLNRLLDSDIRVISRIKNKLLRSKLWASEASVTVQLLQAWRIAHTALSSSNIAITRTGTLISKGVFG